MAASLAHVLLTRFNLPSVGLEGTIRAADGWLVDRVGLFERYCLPSVEAQTVRRFRWIIYFDPESPAWLREWIAAGRQRAAFTAIFRATVNGGELLADVHAVAADGADELITTNVDNDDALAADFVERLQAAPVGHRRAALYLRNGLVARGEALYLRSDPDNAFCSVRERAEAPVLCWADWHNRLKLTMPVVRLGGAPGWLQVVHGRNVSNRVRGRRVSPRGYEALFPGALTDMRPPTAGERVKEILVDRPTRTVLEAGRGAIKHAALATMGRDGPDRLRQTLQSVAGGRARVR